MDLGNLTGGTSLAGFGLAEQKLRVAPSWYRVDGHGIEEWHLLLTHDAVELAGDTVSGFLADPAGDEPTGGTILGGCLCLADWGVAQTGPALGDQSPLQREQAASPCLSAHYWG